MERLKLHITNANQQFTDKEIDAIQQATKRAEKFVTGNFSLDYEIDIMVTAPSYLMKTIPEDGISGRTYSSQLISLVLDKQQRAINEDIIFETICHELSHSLRWEKLPEYSKTLFDSMIFEGLAIVLEEKAINETGCKEKQFFLKEMQNTSQKMIDHMISELNTEMKNEQYDYSTIFFAGNDTLPRWAGYRLGYHYVKNYLEKTGLTICEVTVASYADFSINA